MHDNTFIVLERADQLEELKLTKAIFTSFVPVTIIVKKSNKEK
jgi:hypothetical protein